jgi:hypothetical protein
LPDQEYVNLRIHLFVSQYHSTRPTYATFAITFLNSLRITSCHLLPLPLPWHPLRHLDTSLPFALGFDS